MDYSNRWLLLIRRGGQSLGILRPLQRMYRSFSKKDYEDRFDLALMKEIRRADIVWDVGANVGLYTTRFAEAVGPDGFVNAFEPAPVAAENVRAVCSRFSNVKVLQIALSDFDGTADFQMSSESAVTNSLAKTDGAIVGGSVDGVPAIEVRVATGDSLVSRGECQCPAVIKLDVEGFELEVLKGMRSTLGNVGLRGVFIEVHFLELNKRGLKDAPREIVQILRDSGFEAAWCDPSHIVATRG